MYEGELQKSHHIREHLDELYAAFDVSENKELLTETIEEWSGKLELTLEREKIERDNKYKQKNLSYKRKTIK